MPWKPELKRLDQSLSPVDGAGGHPARRLLRLWPGEGETPVRLSALSLKLIAIAAMVVDHVAFTFVPYGTPVDRHGRRRQAHRPHHVLYGCRGLSPHQEHPALSGQAGGLCRRQLLPFLYFCAMGQPEQMNPLRLNVIYTISLGVLAVWVRRRPWPTPPGRPAPPAGLPEHPRRLGHLGLPASSSCWTSITATSAIRPSATHWSSVFRQYRQPAHQSGL